MATKTKAKIVSLLIIFLATCAEEARFYGNPQAEDSPQMGGEPNPPLPDPDVDCKEQQIYRQRCEEDLEKVKRKYYELKARYRKLARRYRHHMEQYHCDGGHYYGNQSYVCSNAKSKAHQD